MDLLSTVNSYKCQDCGWMTLVINLNTGITPSLIPCMGKQVDNPDKNNILFGNESHMVRKQNYEAQDNWLTGNGKLYIERGFARPTQDQITKWCTLGDVYDLQMFNKRLEEVMEGKLFLMSLKEPFEQAPVLPRFGFDDDQTADYLATHYSL